MNSTTLSNQTSAQSASRFSSGTAWPTAQPERLRFLTMTGIDEGLPIDALYEISRHYPIAEFGVLLSDKLAGQGRYPSLAWISELVEALRLDPGPRVALHVCGTAVCDLLAGTSKMLPMLEYFSRVQLNFTANRYPLTSLRRLLKASPAVTFITQYAPGKEDLWKDLSDLPNHAVLFDASGGIGGNGIGPVTWPAPLDKTQAGLPFKSHSPLCGYAGGLGPDNLERRLREINHLTKKAPFWLDMEAKLRVNDKFDIGSALKCLEIAQAAIDAQKNRA